MKSLLHVLWFCIVTGFLLPALPSMPADLQGTVKPQVAVDPQTGWAVGAKEMKPDELRALIEQKAKMIIIDVRDEVQFEKETIKGAIHIPYTDLEARLKDIPKDTNLVFTCNTERRSSQAAKLAEQVGFKTAVFSSIQDWKQKNYETEPGKKK